MKVEIIDRPVYNLIMTKEDKRQMLYTAKMLKDLWNLDHNDQIWKEFKHVCDPNNMTKEFGGFVIDNFNYWGELLEEVVALAEIRD